MNTSSTVLRISGINCYNIDHLNDCLGIAGYARGSVLINECERSLDLRSPEFRKECGITDAQIHEMIGALVLEGFTVKLAS